MDIDAEDDSPASGTGIDGVEVVGPSLRLRYATIDGVEVVGPSLRLRYATALDAPALLELGSDPEVTRFFSWGPYVSASEPAAYIDGLAGERESGERLDFLIVGPDDEAIGVIGLSEFSRRDRRAVVGTWLGRSYWGTGANQSAKTLIAWLAFAVLGLERLGAYTDIENPRSQSALVGLGFVPEGTLRRWHRHGEHVHDVLLYSWLKQDWERSPMAQTRVSLRGRPPGIFCS